MEDIRAARLSQEPAILLLTSAGSQMERDRGGLGGKSIGACFFGEGTKELPSEGWSSFSLVSWLSVSHSPSLTAQGWEVKTDTWVFLAKTLHDVMSCHYTDRPTNLVSSFSEKSAKGEFCIINFVSRELIARDRKKSWKLLAVELETLMVVTMCPGSHVGFWLQD